MSDHTATLVRCRDFYEDGHPFSSTFPDLERSPLPMKRMWWENCLQKAFLLENFLNQDFVSMGLGKCP